MPRKAIEAHANLVKIPYLLHFTRAQNLPAIMSYGLYPLSRIHEINIQPAINDELRLDGRRDSTSLSIGFPNSRMFYKYRTADASVNWVILAIVPSVLWAKTCAFCRHNAADARISCQAIDALRTPAAFVGMYDEVEGLPSRTDQRLKTYDPTDIQAEVLVTDIIEPAYIYAVVFQNATLKFANQQFIGDRKAVVQPGPEGLFAARSYERNGGR